MDGSLVQPFLRSQWAALHCLYSSRPGWSMCLKDENQDWWWVVARLTRCLGARHCFPPYMLHMIRVLSCHKVRLHYIYSVYNNTFIDVYHLFIHLYLPIIQKSKPHMMSTSPNDYMGIYQKPWLINKSNADLKHVNKYWPWEGQY